MKTSRILSLIILIIFISIYSQAQPCPEDEGLNKIAQADCGQVAKTEHPKAMKGTYQFFVVGEDSTQLLRTDLAEKIESYRDENMIVHLKVSSTTTIRILPKNEINNPRFTPLTQEVIFQPDYSSQTAKK